MKSTTTVVICTLNRATVLDETVRSLLSHLPFQSEIVVCAGSMNSVLPQTAALPLVRSLGPVRGLTKQRNAALRDVSSKYSLFIDDDVELDGAYIRSMEHLFDREPNIVLSTGSVVLDRPLTRKTQVTRDEAVRALQHESRQSGYEQAVHLPGHNMFVRTEVARAVGFDEFLPLYGLYEDLDFSHRCRSLGLVVRNCEARIAHLRAEVGRISEFQMGYSQFANSWYLRKKGVVESNRQLFGRFWLRPFSANLLKSFAPRGRGVVDRRGRLRGNIAAMMDLLRQTSTPERIVSFSSGRHND